MENGQPVIIAVLIDPACGIPDALSAKVCQAIDAQAREIIAVHKLEPVPVELYSWDALEKQSPAELTAFAADRWFFIVKPDIEDPGALGFHFDKLGVVGAWIEGPPRNADWTVTLSHEVAETVGDRTCDVYTALGDGRSQAFELADRVEGDTYEVDGVLVSNYLLPAAFVPGSAGPWDKLTLLTRWDETRPGGYMIVLAADGTTSDVFAETEQAKAIIEAKKARTWSRLARRLA